MLKLLSISHNPNNIDGLEIARISISICAYVGQAQLQLFDLTPLGALFTAWLPGFKGSSAGYRFSAVISSMSFLFGRWTE